MENQALRRSNTFQRPWAKGTRLLLLGSLITCAASCAILRPRLEFLPESDRVYQIQQGKPTYTDPTHHLSETVPIQSLENWYVIAPGTLTELFEQCLDKHPDGD